MLIRRKIFVLSGLLLGCMPALAQYEGDRGKPCNATCRAWMRWDAATRVAPQQDWDDDDEDDDIEEVQRAPARPKTDVRLQSARGVADTRKAVRLSPPAKPSRAVVNQPKPAAVAKKLERKHASVAKAAAPPKQRVTAVPRAVVPLAPEPQTAITPRSQQVTSRETQRPPESVGASKILDSDAALNNQPVNSPPNSRDVGEQDLARSQTEEVEATVGSSQSMAAPAEDQQNGAIVPPIDRQAFASAPLIGGSSSEIRQIFGLSGSLTDATLSIGEFVDPSITLEPLPEAFKALRPYFAELLYAVIGDTAVLVRPETRKVVMTY